MQDKLYTAALQDDPAGLLEEVERLVREKLAEAFEAYMNEEVDRIIYGDPTAMKPRGVLNDVVCGYKFPGFEIGDCV